MGLAKRFEKALSRKGTIKAWYGLVIAFFIFMVIVPTLFVLSYAVTGWDDIQSDIFTEPPEPTYTMVELESHNTTVSFSAPDIIDITEPISMSVQVQTDAPVYFRYDITTRLDSSTRLMHYSHEALVNQSGMIWINITANETFNQLKIMGDFNQSAEIIVESGVSNNHDMWEVPVHIRAGSQRPMDMIWDAMKVSFVIATIVTIIDFIAGLPMAWIMVRKNFRGKKYLDTLIDMPLAIPTAALGFSTALFWAVTPTLPGAGLGLTSSPFILIILLHIVFSYPYMVRSLAAILHEIDINYEVAAQTLGAPPLTVARTITLPLFRAGLVTGIILCFSRSLSETGGTVAALAMLKPWLSEMAYPMQTGPTLIGAWKHAGGFEPQLAFTAMLLVMISLALLVVVKIVVMKFKLPLRKVMPGPERLLSRGIAPKLKDGLALIFMVVVLLIPSFFLFTFIFTGEPAPVDWATFWSSMGFSFLVAGVITLLNILFGVPLAILIVRGKSKVLSNILDVLVNMPLIVPTAALGVSLGMFWNSMHIELALFLVISAHLAFTFPLVVRNVAGSLEELGPTYEETARTLGAKPMFVFKKVMYPSIKFSILAGAIMAFTRSLGETGATLAVVNDANTVPVYIVKLVQNLDYYPAALACIVLIAITFITMMIMRFITRKAER
ncbi:MAG: ABC transporter permease subunit [Thermoplasmata archaeon]